MPSRAALIFSLACAALASVGTFFAVERNGDPLADVREVQTNIEAIRGLFEKHTVKIRPSSSPKPDDPSRAGFLLEKRDGTKLVIDAPKSATPHQLEAAADSMLTLGRTEFVLLDSAWKEAQSWWSKLTYWNRNAAERMALARFPSKPDSVSSYDWDSRKRESEFSTEEALSFNLRRLGYVAGTLVGVFFFLLLLLAAFGWLWRVLLARVRELASAMRGEPPK